MSLKAHFNVLEKTVKYIKRFSVSMKNGDHKN